MNRALLILFFLIAVTGTTRAQNLVPNGDFEQYSNCPNIGLLNRIVPWTSVTNHLGTPDGFNACASPAGGGVPISSFGYQHAHSGIGYAGHYLYSKGNENREYLSIELSDSMKPGVSYHISFYYSLSDYVAYAISHYGVYFGKTKPTGASNYAALALTPQFETGTYLTDTMNWTRIEFDYVAAGGEKFMVMGNFRAASASDTLRVTTAITFPINASYILIDDVAAEPVACQGIKGPQEACLNDTLTLYTLNDSVYGWADSLAPETILSTDTFLKVSITTPTTFVLYTSCDTFFRPVHVGSKPIINLGNDTAVCLPVQFTLYSGVSNAALSWSTGDTTSQITVNQPGTYILKATTNGSTCFATDTLVIDTMPGSVVQLGPAAMDGCTTAPVIFDLRGKGYQQVLWQDGSKDSVYTAAGNGLYHVQVSNGQCTARDSVQLIYHPPVPHGFTSVYNLCVGDTLTLDLSGKAQTALWNGNVNALLYQIATSGNWRFTYTDSFCTTTDSVTATFASAPLAALPADTELCGDQQLLLDPANGNFTYAWSTGSTDSFQLVATPGTYVVVVTNNCGTSTDSIQITSCYCLIQVPNVFTPDGNRQNDSFIPQTGCIPFTYRLTIFNRWGEIMFESITPQEGWDGTTQNKKASEGIYFWILEVKSAVNSVAEVRKGTVTLIR